MKFLQVVLIGWVVLCPFSAIAEGDEIDIVKQALKAHGGLEAWNQYGGLEYDVRWAFGKKPPFEDHQLVDLKSRRILIQGKTYTVGFDGKEAWITPDLKALAMPPRFYVGTPFYFFAMPFVFNDSGAQREALDTKSLEGQPYDVVKISFGLGVGDTPEDNYVAYFDKSTHLLKLTHYIVTYPALRQGKAVNQLERHAIVFKEWQTVSGLRVPRKATFYEWTNDVLGKELGTIDFENVVFKPVQLLLQTFSRPPGAAVDTSLQNK